MSSPAVGGNHAEEPEILVEDGHLLRSLDELNRKQPRGRHPRRALRPAVHGGDRRISAGQDILRFDARPVLIWNRIALHGRGRAGRASGRDARLLTRDIEVPVAAPSARLVHAGESGLPPSARGTEPGCAGASRAVEQADATHAANSVAAIAWLAALISRPRRLHRSRPEARGQMLPIGQRHLAQVGEVRAISCAPAEHGDRVADLDRHVFLPSCT